MASSILLPPYPAAATAKMAGIKPKPDVTIPVPMAAAIGIPEEPAKSFTSLKDKPSSSMAISLPLPRPSFVLPFCVRSNRPRASDL